MEPVDTRAFKSLMEESQDLHTDAMREALDRLPDLADVREEMRNEALDPAAAERVDTTRTTLADNITSRWRTGALAGGVGALIAAVVAAPASATKRTDVQILQTASSLEILAVATYEAALGLPFISGGNAVVKAFAETTKDQHDEHRQAFQAQTKQLGGKVQKNPNPKYVPIVEAAKPTLKTPLDVVNLAATLEEVATETYLANLGLIDNARTKALMASVMGVETQHLATLRAVGALLGANAPQLIAIPVDAAALPAVAGSVAFPTATQNTDMASPPEEGAL